MTKSELMKKSANIIFLNEIIQDETSEILKSNFFDTDILVTESLSPQEIIDFILNKGVFHVVQKSNPDYSNNLKYAFEIVDQDCDFVNFPLSVLLLHSFSEIKETSERERQLVHFSKLISDPQDKNSILDELVTSLQSEIKSKSFLDDVRLIADELISNAIYNAPFVNSDLGPGVGQQGRLVSINAEKKPEIFVGFDEKKLIIGCKDFYGSLEPNSILRRIYMGYKNGSDSIINYNEGGAGLGSYIIFNLCNSYYLALAPGQKTTICCTLNRNLSRLKRVEQDKNFSLSLVKNYKEN